MHVANKESKPKFIVSEMDVADIEEATKMRLASWLDTYVNDDYGVSETWVKTRNAEQLSAQRVESRRERFLKGKAAGTFAGWVARDSEGNIIGSTTPFVDSEGHQHVGSIYVDKAWHGTGVGSALMQKVIDWCDKTKPIELGVVAYNERAKAFYRKWGFEEVDGSESLFDDKIPEVKMIRRGAKS